MIEAAEGSKGKNFANCTDVCFLNTSLESHYNRTCSRYVHLKSSDCSSLEFKCERRILSERSLERGTLFPSGF